MSYASGCKGKVPYFSLAEAKRKIREMRDRGVGDRTLNAYECQHCGRFHVGHWPRRKPRAPQPKENRP